MKEDKFAVKMSVEEWVIPTYDFVTPEEMPMFSETSNHQGTTGDPYPARVTSYVDGEHRSDKKWTVVTMENKYIRLAVIPDLGGRIFEAYDKTTGYDFLYRQHVIKPALIGAYGAWMSGGMEFNWPYHHRPSTMMPVDFKLEREEDGTAILWLSEHSPSDRTKGMVGIVLRPDASYFETRMAITNRTSHKRSFLWWENAAVAVHEDYKLIFPPDVTWVHHHYDRSHTTFPLASGQYGADNIKIPKDISKHGNSPIATSYFAAPSRFDFFGGYDFRRNCGILHIADHHISPGKKMFTWGYGQNADKWEQKLTDTDGAYAELMAGSYTDDQPDFTYLAPFETKTFSQFWYPTEGIGYVTYATLDAAISLDRDNKTLNVNVTRERKTLRLLIWGEDGRLLLEKVSDMRPSAVLKIPFEYPDGEKLTVRIIAENRIIFNYTEREYDNIHIPDDNKGIPLPDALKTPCELVVAGKHIDQYRDPLYKPDLYYLEALRRDSEFLPALKELGEYYTRTLRYEEALTYLERAYKIECGYDQNPEDGQVNYLRGLCLQHMGNFDGAYDAFARAVWSDNTAKCAAVKLAEIDGIRGDLAAMYRNASLALEKEMRHPIARVYAALALYKSEDNCRRDTYYGAILPMSGGRREAVRLLREALGLDPLNHLARFMLAYVTGKGKGEFFASLRSDVSQTALDVGFDLMRAGFYDETISLIKGAMPYAKEKAMLRYTLAYCLDILGDTEGAKKQRYAARKQRIVDFFPVRAEEATVLDAALEYDANDGFAAYLLGCLRYNFREYEKAAALWESAIKNIPDFYIPYRNLALVYFNHLDRACDALELMKQATSLKKGDAMLLGELETVMRKTGYDPADTLEILLAGRPDEETDQMQLTLARAYNGAGRFDEAEKAMLSHTFSPGEGAELTTAEPYIFSCFARGRVAFEEGRYTDALELFKMAQTMPDNLNVGFWNESVMMPYLYFEAVTYKKLGREEEANSLMTRLSSLRDEGMWNMGGEFVYYFAETVRACGDEMRAQSIIREAILAWEKELSSGCRYSKKIGTLYNCFVGDGSQNRRAELYAMLAFADLFLGKREDAKAKFEISYALDPTAKVAFEISLLK